MMSAAMEARKKSGGGARRVPPVMSRGGRDLMRRVAGARNKTGHGVRRFFPRHDALARDDEL
jgi:hypothetical protein